MFSSKVANRNYLCTNCVFWRSCYYKGKHRKYLMAQKQATIGHQDGK